MLVVTVVLDIHKTGLIPSTQGRGEHIPKNFLLTAVLSVFAFLQPLGR